MAGETNPTGPSPMTDTDAGKRLSEKDLAAITARNNIEKNYRAVYNEVISGADADVAKLLSHIAAITANRGSVSEDRINEIAAHVTAAKMIRGEALGASSVARVCVTAIQQAVSECSGVPISTVQYRDAIIDECLAVMAQTDTLGSAETDVRSMKGKP